MRVRASLIQLAKNDENSLTELTLLRFAHSDPSHHILETDIVDQERRIRDDVGHNDIELVDR